MTILDIFILVLSKNLHDVYTNSVESSLSDSVEPSVVEGIYENDYKGGSSLFKWKNSNLLTNNQHEPNRYDVTVTVHKETPLKSRGGEKKEVDETRIIGGYRVSIQRAPSYVVIFYKGAQICTGNLISKQHVLTAAHCVTNIGLDARAKSNFCRLRPRYFTIRAGSTYSEEGGQIVYGWLINIHPEFLAIPAKVNLFRDIAVIKLWNEVTLGTTTKISRIHPQLEEEDLNKIGGLKCMVSGWGSWKYNGQLSTHLKQTTVTMLDMDMCENSYNRVGVNSTVQLCALDENTDTCQGDSGAALFCNGDIIAITSWGFRCGIGMPAVYARVDNAGDFIQKALATTSSCYMSVIAKVFLTACLFLSYY